MDLSFLSADILSDAMSRIFLWLCCDSDSGCGFSLQIWNVKMDNGKPIHHHSFLSKTSLYQWPKILYHYLVVKYSLNSMFANVSWENVVIYEKSIAYEMTDLGIWRPSAFLPILEFSVNHWCMEQVTLPIKQNLDWSTFQLIIPRNPIICTDIQILPFTKKYIQAGDWIIGNYSNPKRLGDVKSLWKKHSCKT